MRQLVLAALALLGVAVAVTAGLARPQPVSAHPLGNFTVSRYSRIDLTPGLVRLRYVVDMAEIPTFQERSAIDTDRDGRIDEAEANAYAERQVETVRGNLRLAVNGRTVALRLVERPEISFPEGQGGLDTLRLAAWYEGTLPSLTGAVGADYRDDNFPDRLGWKEIVVRGGPGIDLAGSTAPDQDLSDELRRYPDDMLQNPLDQRAARFSLAPGAGKELTGSTTPATSVPVRKQDRFAALIARELTLPVFLLSLVIAMGLGALHALGPGHGKTVVAAYLVGSRGTTKHAVFLGLTVTVTHTSSVFVLGGVTLWLSEYILPEQLFPWLSFLSGAGIALLGLVLLAGRTRTLLARRHAPALVPLPVGAPVSSQGQIQAPAHSRMRHYAPEHDHGPGRRAMLGHTHDGYGLHSHGGRSHSHLPPGAAGERVTWRSLLALGISGGMLPCPSALVVLLTAISLHRVGYGLLLILAFSVGLAAVLTGIGLLLVHARGLFSRLPIDSVIARVAPVVSAAVVTVLGVVIAVRALTGGSNLSI